MSYKRYFEKIILRKKSLEMPFTNFTKLYLVSREETEETEYFNASIKSKIECHMLQ